MPSQKGRSIEHLWHGRVAVHAGYQKRPMVEQLQAHDQLDLLYDMEQPLAAVLAKMEIAGIKVERQTLEACRWTEWSWSSLPKIYELAGAKSFNVNSPS